MNARWPLSNVADTHERRLRILEQMESGQIWRLSQLQRVMAIRNPDDAFPTSTLRADLHQLVKCGWVRKASVDETGGSLWLRTDASPSNLDRESLERWLAS